ncbi:MAG: IS66 family transposase [Acidobacteriota bacterium]|nr:IS66 family transposase [Acidobacteriota bacterium]
MRRRNTEKTSAVLEPKVAPAAVDTPEPEQQAAAGHGRNGAAAFTGANRVAVAHATLHSGDPCPGCQEGRVYRQKEPATVIRIMGQAPLKATVFEMERLRCNACGEMFTAIQPQSAGPEKFDPTAVAMIALLKYGTGMPFHRMERLEGQLGMPLPAATQWELMEAAAKQIKRILDEFIRQAAQGGVMHNDDTSMRVLKLARNTDDGRTGVFTSGIVSICGEWKIALYFTGWKHAGENLADVLKQRAGELKAPIQMCDALSRNSPKLIETLLANCLAHGRRQFTEVAESFPDECRYVLESLGTVYGFDAEAKDLRLTPGERLTFHQRHSAPVMEDLSQWMENQFAEHRTEPNSGLGKAISYLLRHWTKLTLFLRQQGAPLDNNVVERALKKAILHRKNALFYKTMNGARVGDLFMSLIHTCEMNKINPFDYLTELLRHPAEVAVRPAEWMPWNYRSASNVVAA